MRAVFGSLILILIPLLFTGCRSAIISKDDLNSLNEELSQQKFRARQEIKPGFASSTGSDEASFPSGTLLKLRVESAGSWVRVRARRASENEEQRPGTIIIYLFREDFPEKSSKETKELLKQKIQRLAAPAGS